MMEIAIVIIGLVVFLAFMAFSDSVTDKDREEDDTTENEPPA
jgi:hypothetical protein